MTCAHDNIGAAAHVVKTSSGATSIMMQVACNDCGIPFQFRGAPGGASPNFPRISTDHSTLCAPIEPTPPDMEIATCNSLAES